jgi:hypothetical protein
LVKYNRLLTIEHDYPNIDYYGKIKMLTKK